jgi:hypothetical protein
MKPNKIHLIIITILIFSQSSFSHRFDPDTVKAQKYDMGKMWTFENPPLDYFEETYGFRPSAEWLEQVSRAALRYGRGCSASFISEDGLIMTNHHCARGQIPTVQRDGEDFLSDGFFAKNLSEERRVEGLFVDQLLVIEDVTEEVHSAMDKAATDQDKVKLRRAKIVEIEERFVDKDNSLIYRVVPLYNGGKYSLYGYKRYEDIRLVFAPDLRTAKFGGDYDNFTYPRYGLDCTFLRAYENDKPVKSEYYFRWNEKGAAEGEVVFVVGYPGSTNRLSTIAQMEYTREIQYPMMIDMLRQLYALEESRVMAGNAEDFQLIARLYTVGNTLKVYEGTLEGLNDEYLMARKKDFENTFRNAVTNDPALVENYSGLWDEIAELRQSAAVYAGEIFAYTINPFYSSEYFLIASNLIKLALQIDKMGKMPYSEAEMDSLLRSMYPDDIDREYQRELLKIQTGIIIDNLGAGNPLVQKIFGSRRGYDAADHLIANSRLRTEETFLEFARMGTNDILNSDDPFIYYVVNTQERLAELRRQNEKINSRETINNQLLGEALFHIYGDSIPPDATGTLRIADGVLLSYSYNGTIAPVFTTFYGVLDRYLGFGKRFPYNLPEFWENLPREFNPGAKLNFISTNDIIGGNSGSPVINKKGEIIGLAFDGNIESLPNRFIYTTEANRTVSVHTEGMIEAIRYLYNADRVSNEILNGKMD